MSAARLPWLICLALAFALTMCLGEILIAQPGWMRAEWFAGWNAAQDANDVAMKTAYPAECYGILTAHGIRP